MRNLNNRVWVYVKPFADLAALNYGFLSGAETSIRAALGQSVIAQNTPITGLVIGANNCHPPRAVRKRVTGSEGSFCSAGVITALRAAGYNIKPGKRPKPPKSSTLSAAYFITINGVKRGWNSPKSSVPLQAGQIGLQTVAGTEEDIIMGCEFPLPPRLQLPGTEQSPDSFSSFADPSNQTAAITQGWKLIHEGNHTLTHFKERYVR